MSAFGDLGVDSSLQEKKLRRVKGTYYALGRYFTCCAFSVTDQPWE